MNIEAATRQYHKILECATKAGFAEHTFCGFGTLLGCVREHNLIGHDDDTDFCIRADKITKEQELDFFDRLDKAKLFKYRRRKKFRHDTGRLIWVSLKWEDPGTKSCIWFWQPWNGFYWHTKGENWVEKIGLRLKPPVKQSFQAIMKGVRYDLLSELQSVDFLGGKFNIPKKYGTVLDLWYPGWAIPKKGGASLEDYLAIIPDWRIQKSWVMRRR